LFCCCFVVVFACLLPRLSERILETRKKKRRKRKIPDKQNKQKKKKNKEKEEEEEERQANRLWFGIWGTGWGCLKRRGTTEETLRALCWLLLIAVLGILS